MQWMQHHAQRVRVGAQLALALLLVALAREALLLPLPLLQVQQGASWWTFFAAATPGTSPCSKPLQRHAQRNSMPWKANSGRLQGLRTSATLV